MYCLCIIAYKCVECVDSFTTNKTNQNNNKKYEKKDEKLMYPRKQVCTKKQANHKIKSHNKTEHRTNK